jgi:predicted phosphodiesterase
MLRFVVVGDLHYSETTPYYRIDNFVETRTQKLQEIKEYAKVNPITAILELGDFFDHPKITAECLSDVFTEWEKNIRFNPNSFGAIPLIGIEGNHELHLRRYCGLFKYPKLGEEGFFKNLCTDFSRTTQLEYEMETSEKMIEVLRDLNTYLQEYLIIKRGSQTYICTHGGLRNISQLWYYLVGNLTYGNRDIENYDKSFSSKVYKKNYKNIFSIHGHCKYPKYCIHKYPGVVNLDADTDNMVAIFRNLPEMNDEKIDENITIRRK